MSQRNIEPVMATEGAECGLACIVMLAKSAGYNCSLRELRGRFPMTLKGATVAQLVKIAASLGLQARALRLEFDEVPQLATPCILHWDMNHFVVLQHQSKETFRVLDPAKGAIDVAAEEFRRRFTGIAVELTAGADFQKRERGDTHPLLRDFLQVDGIRTSLAILLALSAAMQLMVLIAPLLLQSVIDHALPSGSRDLLIIISTGIVGAVVIQALLAYTRNWAVLSISTQLGLQWTGNVFSHLTRLPIDFFERRHVGDIVSRVASVDAIRRVVSTTTVGTLVDGLLSLVTLAMLLVYSPTIATIVLISALTILAIRVLTFKALRSRSAHLLSSSADSQTFLLETIRGMQTIRLAGITPLRNSTYLNRLSDVADREVSLSRLQFGLGLSTQLIAGLERAAVIFIGAGMVLSGSFSIGMLVAGLTYQAMFSSRIITLLDSLTSLRMLGLHLERLSDIVDSSPENAGTVRSEMPPQDFSIELRSVGFRYSTLEPWVINDLSLSIADGESVAIVGPSGCGKSTLAKVICGLLRAETGGVYIAGKNINHWGLANYRQWVSTVLQEDQLLAGSVADNIALFDETANQKRIEWAASLAAIHRDIVNMPMGYHTLVGDMGSVFSSGQKQRLLLARALYRKPRLLILDEATSHLDVACERAVNGAIESLRMTRIIIAHRPETIQSADRIITLAPDSLDIARHRDPARITP